MASPCRDPTGPAEFPAGPMGRLNSSQRVTPAAYVAKKNLARIPSLSFQRPPRAKEFPGQEISGPNCGRGGPSVATPSVAVAQDRIQPPESPKAAADSRRDDASPRVRHGRDAEPPVCGLWHSDRALLQLVPGEG